MLSGSCPIKFLPPIIFTIPLLLIFSDVGLVNTYQGLILIYTVFSIAFVVWMMKGFFDEVPRDIEESARVDGCSWFGTMWRISLPLVVPGFVAVLLLTFIFLWTELLFGVIFLSGDKHTIPVELFAFFTPNQGLKWGPQAAMSIMAIAPVLAFAPRDPEVPDSGNDVRPPFASSVVWGGRPVARNVGVGRAGGSGGRDGTGGSSGSACSPLRVSQDAQRQGALDRQRRLEIEEVALGRVNRDLDGFAELGAHAILKATDEDRAFLSRFSLELGRERAGDLERLCRHDGLRVDLDVCEQL